MCVGLDWLGAGRPIPNRKRAIRVPLARGATFARVFSPPRGKADIGNEKPTAGALGWSPNKVHFVTVPPERIPGWPACLTKATTHKKAIAMLYRGIEYSVVQGIVRHHWKWAATVSGTKISGYGSTRDEAIGNAEKAIERAIQKQRSGSAASES